MKIFLNKFLSGAGACSRRQAAEYIKAGLVKVNGIIVKEPWKSVSESDHVELKSKSIIPDKKIYILLNKPKDYVTTLSDEKGRQTVMDLLKGATKKRIYPVGRLDRATTGLLLITNDGYLTQYLSHPKHEVQKVYSVVLDRPLPFKELEAIREGFDLKDGFIKVDKVGYVLGKKKSHLKIQLHSGKNRIVRRIFEHVGFKVLKLDRISYAGLTKRGLPLGRWRLLTQQEIRALKDSGQVQPARTKIKGNHASRKTARTQPSRRPRSKK